MGLDDLSGTDPNIPCRSYAFLIPFSRLGFEDEVPNSWLSVHKDSPFIFARYMGWLNV